MIRICTYCLYKCIVMGFSLFFFFLGERPFKCTQCDRAFNQKGALRIHMSKHTGVKPHPCDFCPMSFAQRGNLRAHIQVFFRDGMGRPLKN